MAMLHVQGSSQCTSIIFLTLEASDQERDFSSHFQDLLGSPAVCALATLDPDRVQVEEDKTHVLGENHCQALSLDVLLDESCSLLGSEGCLVTFISVASFNNLKIKLLT